jgi:hypothetical protein
VEDLDYRDCPEYWESRLNVLKAYAFRMGYIREAEDFAQWALLEELEVGKSRKKEWQLVDYLRHEHGDKRSKYGKYNANKVVRLDEEKNIEKIFGHCDFPTTSIDDTDFIKEYAGIYYYGSAEDYALYEDWLSHKAQNISLDEFCRIKCYAYSYAKHIIDRVQKNMPSQDRMVKLILLIGAGKSLDECAKEIEVHPSRVSQLLKIIKAAIVRENQKKEPILQLHLPQE